MGYIESSLLPGETVVARARLHRVVFTKAVAVGIVGLALLVFQPAVGAVVVLLGLAMTFPPFVTARSSEFAVTNKRIIIKVGVVRRRTLELLLRQVEAIAVEQSIMGRMLNYGTITLTGTGGVREQFANISHPLEFRRAIQGQEEGESGR